MLRLLTSGSAAAAAARFRPPWQGIGNPSSLFSSAASETVSSYAGSPPSSEDEENGAKKDARKLAMLDLKEVEKILSDVKAGDVSVVPISSSPPSPSELESCGSGSSPWTDFMVVATGRSPWHVRNITQALIHRVKEKQKGAKPMLLPRVQGYEGGKWVIVDSGNVVIHALDEKARSYYNLEELWENRASKKLRKV